MSYIITLTMNASNVVYSITAPWRADHFSCDVSCLWVEDNIKQRTCSKGNIDRLINPQAIFLDILGYN